MTRGRWRNETSPRCSTLGDDQNRNHVGGNDCAACGVGSPTPDRSAKEVMRLSIVISIVFATACGSDPAPQIVYDCTQLLAERQEPFDEQIAVCNIDPISIGPIAVGLKNACVERVMQAYCLPSCSSDASVKGILLEPREQSKD